ncbi:hypothetical protein B0T10DRAFT_593414 [Thelonectria olida]|uniref:Uncharacterized protein n=1 Tax=Thelonectria olida TaxID=1576542 RepID=A0A9P9AEG7_9HYPO|nr:hypothetical protein B0T10DRAFT_593414 [Thelonectria olida]
MAVTSWFITVVSMIVAIIALLPGFNSQGLSQKALDLARWTALKDYLNQCKADLAAGSATPKCKDVVRASLPPPPHIDVAPISRLNQRAVTNEPPTPKSTIAESSLSRATLVLVVILVLLCAVILVLEIRKTAHNRTPNHYLDKESFFQQTGIRTSANILDETVKNVTPLSPASTLPYGTGASTSSQPLLNPNLSQLHHHEERAPRDPGDEFSAHNPSTYKTPIDTVP